MEDSVIEDIIQAIAKKLKSLFPKIKIYDEDIKQGYEEPCFFIIWEKDNEKKLVGNRYDFKLYFRIIYFQDFNENEKNNKIYKVREKLEIEFYNVEYNNIYYRIMDKEFEKQDNDLHFTFTVKCQLSVEQNEILLKNIENLTEERKD